MNRSKLHRGFKPRFNLIVSQITGEYWDDDKDHPPQYLFLRITQQGQNRRGYPPCRLIVKGHGQENPDNNEKHIKHQHTRWNQIVT